MRLYACICAIARDEDPEDLKEWLWYHLGLGFERAIIYDNNSRKPIATTLAAEVAAGLAEVVPFPQREAPQLSAYFHALRQWKGRCRWLAFLDIDEFFVPLAAPAGTKGRSKGGVPDVRDILAMYEPFAGIAAHWLMMGSSGHVRRPPGGAVRNYRQALRLESQYKSVVRPEKTLRPLSPHHFAFTPGACAVNEDGFPVTEHLSYPTARFLRINHYYYKSQEDYARKILRGTATPLKSGTRKMDAFYAQLNCPTRTDDAACRCAACGEALADRSPEDVRRMLCAPAEKDLLGYVTAADALAAQRPDDAREQLRLAMRYHDVPPELVRMAASHAVPLPECPALACSDDMAALRAAWLRAENLRASGMEGEFAAHAVQVRILHSLKKLYDGLGLQAQAGAVAAFAADG
ncbi:glycosyltransferase family 2 protein [uncultured Desulfovibrio sp.]|uniref:glycosyltransferase family 2 protein n=1 Tax=uncultured Desulfovibrio sp. TaxID=167968 RepID=UPI002627FEC1|nr:glycosyltransferase family 2 protein [uncultured Desulfovibrio sp.]